MSSISAFNARWDNGGRALDTSFRNDGRIDVAEIEKGGGVAAFASDFRALRPSEQSQVAASLKRPAARSLFERALTPGDAARMRAIQLAPERLGISADDVVQGITLQTLARFPEHAVPASSREAAIEALRGQVRRSGTVSPQALDAFLRANPPATPVVEASALAQALREQPARFADAQLRVVGAVEQISVNRSSGLTYGPRYNVLEGEIDFGLKTTSIVVAQHKLFSPGNANDWIRVYNREEASSFMTIGIIDLSSAHAKLGANGLYTVDGVVRLREDGPRLELKNIDVR